MLELTHLLLKKHIIDIYIIFDYILHNKNLILHALIYHEDINIDAFDFYTLQFVIIIGIFKFFNKEEKSVEHALNIYE